jgi:hypothetical protein
MAGRTIGTNLRLRLRGWEAAAGSRKTQRYSAKQFGGTSANFVRDCERVPKKFGSIRWRADRARKGGRFR